VFVKEELYMPKMKTKKSASKRFAVRPGGTIKRSHAFKRHILTKKSAKNKRQLRGSVPFMRRMCTLCAQCCPSFNIGRTGENPCHELNGASPPARVIKRYLTQPKAIEAGAKMYTGSPSRP